MFPHPAGSRMLSNKSWAAQGKTSMRLLSTMILAAIAATGGGLHAQSPGRAIPDALRSLTHGFGGCGDEPSVSRLDIAFFPSVRFFRGVCVLEHGDSTSATVGIDSDSVLYLLGSTGDFKFLVDRHPPVGLDSTTVLPYIRTGLELVGAIPSEARLIASWDVLPDSIRGVIQPKGKPIYVAPIVAGRGWSGVVYTATPGYHGDFVVRHDLTVLPGGALINRDSVVYRPRGHP